MISNPLQTYKKTRVKTASQGRLIVMLYNEGIKQVRIAENMLGSQQPQLDSAHNAIIKAQDIVTELTTSLDFEKGGEIAHNLFHIYMYFKQKLVDANFSKETFGLKEVRLLMEELRSAWISIENTPPPQEDALSGGVDIAG